MRPAFLHSWQRCQDATNLFFICPVVQSTHLNSMKASLVPWVRAVTLPSCLMSRLVVSQKSESLISKDTTSALGLFLCWSKKGQQTSPLVRRLSSSDLKRSALPGYKEWEQPSVPDLFNHASNMRFWSRLVSYQEGEITNQAAGPSCNQLFWSEPVSVEI